MRTKKIFILIGTLAVILTLLVSFTACNMSNEEIGNRFGSIVGALLMTSVSNFTPSTDKEEIEGYLSTATGGVNVVLPEGTFSAIATTGKLEEKDYVAFNVDITAITVTADAFNAELVGLLQQGGFSAYESGYLYENAAAAIFVSFSSSGEKTYSINVNIMNANDFTA